LDIIKLPNKVVDILFNWVELMPLSSKHLSFISKQHKTIKSVNSTFTLPNFFIKQIELYKACTDLKHRLTAQTPVSSDKIIKDVKKIFFASLSSMTSGLKLIQHLDKTRVIHLNKISKSLPINIVKGNCILSLVSRSAAVADTTWTLYIQIKKEKACAKDRYWHPSLAVTKNLIKLGLNSLKLTATSLKTAVLFFGFCLNLVKANSIVSLVSSSVAVADTTWTLYVQIKKEKACAQDRDWHLSPLVRKNMMKLGSNSLRLSSHSLKAAVIFFGYCFNPFILVSITTLSFAILLSGKIQSNNLSFRNTSRNPEETLAFLPA
jgi:hypothetical protein